MEVTPPGGSTYLKKSRKQYRLMLKPQVIFFSKTSFDRELSDQKSVARYFLIMEASGWYQREIVEVRLLSFHTFKQPKMDTHGWCQKPSDRETGASDRGAEMAKKNAVFVHHFAKFPPKRTQNFLQQGARCFRQGGCSPL